MPIRDLAASDSTPEGMVAWELFMVSSSSMTHFLIILRRQRSLSQEALAQKASGIYASAEWC
jgi:hypothetical protein